MSMALEQKPRSPEPHGTPADESGAHRAALIVACLMIAVGSGLHWLLRPGLQRVFDDFGVQLPFAATLVLGTPTVVVLLGAASWIVVLLAIHATLRGWQVLLCHLASLTLAVLLCAAALAAITIPYFALLDGLSP